MSEKTWLHAILLFLGHIVDMRISIMDIFNSGSRSYFCMHSHCGFKTNDFETRTKGDIFLFECNDWISIKNLCILESTRWLHNLSDLFGSVHIFIQNELNKTLPRECPYYVHYYYTIPKTCLGRQQCLPQLSVVIIMLLHEYRVNWNKGTKNCMHFVEIKVFKCNASQDDLAAS